MHNLVPTAQIMEWKCFFFSKKLFFAASDCMFVTKKSTLAQLKCNLSLVLPADRTNV